MAARDGRSVVSSFRHKEIVKSAGRILGCVRFGMMVGNPRQQKRLIHDHLWTRSQNMKMPTARPHSSELWAFYILKVYSMYSFSRDALRFEMTEHVEDVFAPHSNRAACGRSSIYLRHRRHIPNPICRAGAAPRRVNSMRAEHQCRTPSTTPSRLRSS